MRAAHAAAFGPVAVAIALIAAAPPVAAQSGAAELASAAAPLPEGDTASRPAAEPYRLDAQLRLRGSAGRRLATLGPGFAAKTQGWFQRSRLGVSFDRGDLAARVQLQSSSAFGVAQPGSDPVALGLQQGWLRARVPALGEAWVDAGRLALQYGLGRQIGDYDFDLVGHAFDGVRAHYGLGGQLAVDGLAVKLRRAAGQPDLERNLAGAYLTGRPSDAFSADLYFLYLQDGASIEDAELLTMGARLDLTPARWLAADLEAAVQIGEVTVANVREPQDHLAWMAAGQVSLTGQFGVDMGVSAVGQMFSGDDQPADRTRRAWRPLYPSRDRLVGLLQLLDPSNLLQVGGAWHVAVPAWGGHMRAECDVRINRAAAAGPLPAFGGGALGQGGQGWVALGTQADLKLRWGVDTGRELLGAVAVFAPDAALARERNAQTALLILLQWTAAF
ncbi:MAG: alginate export family protein [Deltaproteobacteria bacterium]|nr:alginate export family protein [Deltaproteobacteria bacterium]